MRKDQDFIEKQDSRPESGSGILSGAATPVPPLGDVARPAGYRMIESVEIQNFRGFRQIALSGLRHVNIIVGDNSSGKTAFLEALFLASTSSPQSRSGKLIIDYKVF